MPYVEKLFDTKMVQSIDIVVDEDDWQNLLDNAQEKEYITCSIVIDGTALNNVGIRTKGNSSLSQVTTDRYSFKVEFDHYDDAQNYYGLDKLCLNNLIQDNTYLKDYSCYDMFLSLIHISIRTSSTWSGATFALLRASLITMEPSLSLIHI